MALDRRSRRKKVKARIKKKITGTSETLRFSVFRSNKHIYAQLVNDKEGQTLMTVSTLTKEVSEQIPEKNKTEQAEIVGKYLAEKALSANVKTVVFDRSGYKYHGRIKALADGARKGGLIF
ncbi:MAG: 50S ribosomal protein L18 [Bacteroidota bacterium]|nr:50S ribosomal protein L18 [Bacteroidota bacterium]